MISYVGIIIIKLSKLPCFVFGLFSILFSYKLKYTLKLAFGLLSENVNN
jgi:hypothetical protein